MHGSRRVRVVEDEVSCIFRRTSDAKLGKLGTEQARRAEVWAALFDLGAARRCASRLLIQNTGDSAAVSHALDGLLALEEWRVTLLTALGLPDSVVTLIDSFLCLLERTRLTSEESQRLLRVPQLWSPQLAARKWRR